MKTKLFLLVGCLFAAMTLNAQTPEVVVENEVAAEASASQSVTVYVYYDTEAKVAKASVSSALSCALRIKGTVNWPNANHTNGQATFFIRIPVGSSSGSASVSNETVTGGGYPSDRWAIQLDEEPLQSCDGSVIKYSLENNGYNW